MRPIRCEYEGLTQAMFYEFRHQTSSGLQPIFTLKHKNWAGCKSMYLLYMGYDTEYDAAIGILGSWPHWQKLCATSWFSKHKEEWDEERKLRDEAVARKALLTKARDGDVPAAKAILAEDRPKRGRPKNNDRRPNTHDKELEEMVGNFRLINGNKE